MKKINTKTSTFDQIRRVIYLDYILSVSATCDGQQKEHEWSNCNICTGKSYIEGHGKDLEGVSDEKAEHTNSTTQWKEYSKLQETRHCCSFL
jgi:hypothetical protein